MALKKPLSRPPRTATRTASPSARKAVGKLPVKSQKAPARKAKATPARAPAKPAPKPAAAKPAPKAVARKPAAKPAKKPVRATRKAVPKSRLPAARKTAAKPAPKAAKAPRRAAAKPAPERQLASHIVDAALELKAEAVVLFDMQRQSSITDYVVLCSGRSQGHVRGIADKIEQQLKLRQVRPLSVEGYTEGSWVVLDYGDVIAHVFHPETRQHYDLESLLKSFPREAFAGSTAAIGPGARGTRS